MLPSPTQGPAAPESITRVLSSQSTATAQTNRSARTNHSARSNASDASGRTPLAANENKDPSSPRLDLNTARVSLVMELTAYTMMATAKTGTLFTAYTVLGSLAAGFTPSVQSLALGIYAGRGGEETGKLFGALSVVQALGYTLLVIRSRYACSLGIAAARSSLRCFSGSRTPGRLRPSPRRCSSLGLRPLRSPCCAPSLSGFPRVGRPNWSLGQKTRPSMTKRGRDCSLPAKRYRVRYALLGAQRTGCYQLHSWP